MSAQARAARFWTMQDTRVVLIAGGILGLAVGALVLLMDVAPRQYLAIAIWLVMALIVHDGIIAMVVLAVEVGGRRAAARVPDAIIRIVQVTLAVGGIVALLVVPEIVGKATGSPKNPTVLPLNYGVNLAVFLAALVVLAAVGIVLHRVLARRRSSAQD